MFVCQSCHRTELFVVGYADLIIIHYNYNPLEEFPSVVYGLGAVVCSNSEIISETVALINLTGVLGGGSTRRKVSSYTG
jgi:hypothetical protein